MITLSYHFIYIEQLFTGLGTPSLVRSAMFTQVYFTDNTFITSHAQNKTNTL